MKFNEILERIKTRRAEITQRVAAIRNEMNADGADLNALEEEMRNLVTEQDSLDLEEQRARIDHMAEGGQSRSLFGPTEGSEDPEPTERFAPNSAEYRRAYLRNLQGFDITAEERAAISAAAVIPTITMNKIVGRLKMNPILAEIDMMHIPGNVSFPVADREADASWVEMATASTDSADTYNTTVDLAAYKLIKTIEITADIQAMAIDAFEDWIVKSLGNKMSRALTAAVIKGTGTGQPKGIVTEIQPATGTWANKGMNYKELLGIIASLPTEYTYNAKFCTTRTTFYTEILGMTTNTGFPVIVADPQAPGKFTILGFPAIIEDAMKVEDTENLIFGDFTEYKLNFSKDPEIKSDDSVGFRTGSRVYRSMALCDGKVADKNAFSRYEKAGA